MALSIGQEADDRDADATQDDGHCEHCLPLASAGPEDEIRELEARRAAVERRLKGFVQRSQERS